MDADPDFVRAMNAVMLGFLVAVFAIVVLASSDSSTEARADRFSQQTRLPYGSWETRESVIARVRSTSRSSAIAVLVGLVAASPLLLTPLSTTPAFAIFVVFPVLVVTGAVAAVVSVRERLFHPAPHAPRIARPRALGVGDYLGPVRRVLPWVLACAAGVAFAVLSLTWIRQPDRVDSVYAVGAIVLSAVAIAAFVAVPVLERTVLDQPQPATDTLELAWDDAFRANTLGQLRLSLATAAWIVIALSISALWVGSGTDSGAFATQLPTWGLIVLQFVYPSRGRRLPADLYPDWLRRPASAGGNA